MKRDLSLTDCASLAAWRWMLRMIPALEHLREPSVVREIAYPDHEGPLALYVEAIANEDEHIYLVGVEMRGVEPWSNASLIVGCTPRCHAALHEPMFVFVPPRQNFSLRVDTGPLPAGRVQFCGWSLTRIEMNALGERDLIERAYR